MKDQILQSTKNIIKYININITILLKIFKEVAKSYLKAQDFNKVARSIIEKFTKTIIHTEFYATNKKWTNIEELIN